MSSAPAPAAAAAAEDKPGLLQQLRANPRLPLVIGVAFAVAVLVGLLLWSRSPDYGVLYSSLSDRDGGDIIAKLDTMQVPYRFAANGTTILVPSDDIDRVRLKLASQGLPKGGGVGFELMNKQPFGISQFAEHVNYNRALEGELARSIETIDAVASARVQLAIPKSTVFVRERKKPKASVVLKLYSGRALSSGQVNAISHLVASSVPHLPADSVTIVDSAGHLLSGAGHGDAAVDATHLQYVNQIEHKYQKRIQNLLAPIVGAANIRTQVVADIDFSTNEQTQETYAPNGNPDQATVVSEQRSTQISNGGAGIGGIPGALSNQPSPDQPSPINNPAKKTAQTRGQAAGQGQNQGKLNMAGADGLDNNSGSPNGSSTTQSTINYEVNHTINHIKQPTGRIRRISAAVVINDPNADAKAANSSDGANKPDGLSAARMAQITSLVREAVGYSAARGDSVKVVNLPFSQSGAPETAPQPSWWQNPQWISLAEKLLKYLVVVIAAWLLWRKLVKPLLDRTPGLFPAPVPADGPYEVESEEDQASKAENRLKQQRRQQDAQLAKTTQTIARDDPRMVAMIIRGWMNGRS